MTKYERIIDIKDGVKLKLKTKSDKEKDLVYGTVCYEDGEKIKIGYVVAKSEGFRSYFYWEKENIYIRNENGSISDVVFDIDKRDFKKIHISQADRMYLFKNMYKGNNRSITYDSEIKVNDYSTLLVDKYCSGSDICSSISVFYNDNSVVNLDPIIMSTPADYEVPEYYLWDKDYVYICFNGNNDNIKIEKAYDLKNRKVIKFSIEHDEEYMFSLVKKNKRLEKGTK